MTRLERNTIKKTIKVLRIISTIFLMLFVITFTCIIFKWILIPVIAVIIIPIAFIGLSFGFWTQSGFCEGNLTNYRYDLKEKRCINLLRVAIEAAQTGNFKKAINIQKILNNNHMGIFLNGYLIAMHKNSNDSILQNKANKALSNILEK